VRAVGDGEAEIAVRDHGVGISPPDRERIFERLYQAHAETHLSGLGLGLFLARQIIELHNGRIWVEAPLDGGTRIVVRLPMRSADAAALPAAPHAGG
jgi:signal transduction histidine kinase